MSDQLEYDAFSWDAMAANLLCGMGGNDSDNDNDNGNSNAPGPSPPLPLPPTAEAEHSGPRVSGGFAASGRAAPLTFDELRVGMLLVQNIPPAGTDGLLSKVAGGGGSRGGLPPPPSSAVKHSHSGRDLLAALRNRTGATGGIALAQQPIAPLLPPPPPPPPNASGFDPSKPIESDFVTEKDAVAEGLTQAQLYHLATTMLCVTALGAADRTVVGARAFAGDTPVVIKQFGRVGGPAPPPAPAAAAGSSSSSRVAGSSSDASRALYHRAGRVEEALFNQWRADPNAIKEVLRLGPGEDGGAAAAGGAPTNAAAGAKRAREEGGGGMTIATVFANGTAAAHHASLTAAQQATMNWWAVKGLLVRYVPSNGEDHVHFGKKGAIVECSRKDNRVTLRVEDEGGCAEGAGGFTLIRCPIADVDTVVPKVGGSAMVLRSDYAGEIVTVLGRSKDPATGDPLVSVEIDECSVTLKAEEICQMA